MSLAIAFYPKEGFLHASLTGAFDLAEAKAAVLSMVDYCLKHRHSKVVLDCRQVSGEPTTMERYEFARFMVDQQQGLRRSSLGEWIVALVGDEPLLDHKQRFGETVAVNRGGVFRIASKFEDALAWLGVRDDEAGRDKTED